MTPKKRAKRPAAKKASPEKYRTSGESGQPPRPLVAGPRKKRLSGPPAPRLSNHKARAVWFQARASWPVREAPVHALLRARAAAQRKPQAPIAAEWHCAGPTNIAGRITSLVCHPGDVNKLWAGSAGGVWQSADGGQTWSSLWHAQDILCIGALALDPGNPDIIYCGTGEANLSADSYSGVGLFQSKDAGANWHILADSAATGIPRRIGAIAVDPFDPSHLRLGGVGFKEASASNDLGGLYASHDGGVTWIREEFVSSGNYWCHAVIFHPAKRDCLYATVTEQGTKSGIWRSQDGGQTWKHLTAGLPDSASFGRTSLAISPSFPDILYAFAQDEASGNSDLLLGVFRSDDGGNTWSDISGSEFADENQISYGNSIAVHPTDVDTVICGGVDLHLTQDGGKSWTQVTHWDANRGDANYAHADHHALLMPAAQPGLIYSGNDGGVDLSRDTGTTWQNRSNGLAVTMYYDIDVCQSDSRNFGGGAQDNGTLVTTTGSADDHREILGGDGGWMVYDPADPRHLYGSFYNMGMYRFRDGRPTDVSPPVPENSSIWMCYITLDPKDANVVYTGSTRVWKTTDDAQSWNPVSPSLDDSPISPKMAGSSAALTPARPGARIFPVLFCQAIPSPGWKAAGRVALTCSTPRWPTSAMRMCSVPAMAASTGRTLTRDSFRMCPTTPSS